jgi:hypothetical protein
MLLTFCPDRPQTMIILISASHVAGITGMHHHKQQNFILSMMKTAGSINSSKVYISTKVSLKPLPRNYSCNFMLLDFYVHAHMHTHTYTNTSFKNKHKQEQLHMLLSCFSIFCILKCFLYWHIKKCLSPLNEMD